MEDKDRVGGTLTFFKKLEEKEERTISSHSCSCKDIKLDPSRISDPAIMGLLLGGDTAPSFSSALGLSKIPTNCEKLLIKTLFCIYKKDWLWSVAWDVDQGLKRGQGGSMAARGWASWSGLPWQPGQHQLWGRPCSLAELHFWGAGV